MPMRGCLREDPRRTHLLRTVRAYKPASELQAGCVQPIRRLRDQRDTSSCVGQALASGIHAILGIDVSATQIWTGARRREGELENIHEGTHVSAAVEEITRRGIAQYTKGEESDWNSFSARPSLKDELLADDQRIGRALDHHVTVGSVDAQRTAIADALNRDRVVVWSTGVTDAYCEHRADTLVTDAEVGATSDGHAQRVFAWFPAIDCFGVVNSWGKNWAGFARDGADYHGCVLVPAATLIRRAWDIWIVQVKP